MMQKKKPCCRLLLYCRTPIVGVTLTQKGLSCGQHSPGCLTENKQTIKSFSFKNTKIDRLPSDINWRRMNCWCACFSARHLRECWWHDSSFYVNVSPTHIFGNVQPKNGRTLPCKLWIHFWNGYKSFLFIPFMDICYWPYVNNMKVSLG